MYAVIETGGKQYKVEKGDVIAVERIDGDELVFTPVLLVNRGKVRATAKELEGATVTARAIGEAKGPKITGFTYKAKTNQHRRWGHRQRYTELEITDIKVGGGKKKSSTPPEGGGADVSDGTDET